MRAATTHETLPSSRLMAFDPPPHWDVKPLGYLFDSVGGATPSKDEEAFWQGSIPWVSPKDMKVAVISDAEDHISERALKETRLALLPPSVVLIVVRGMILAHTIPVAVTAREVTINQDMKGLFVKRGLLPGYLSHLLRAISPMLFATVEESGHGTRCLRLDLWRNILVGLPHEEEQRSIIRYIERKTSQIDALIAKKQRQIELLCEKRQALMSQAVTKGLAPNAPMKDSGIPWLGEVLTHWGIEPLKHSITRIEQGWSPQCETRPADESEWGVLKVGCVNGDRFAPEEQKALPPELEPIPTYEVTDGDILMSRGNTRGLVGSAALVRNPRPRLMLCDLLYRFRARSTKADPEFLVLALRSPYVRYQIEREATGTSSSMKKVGQETIRELVVCLPPVEEQKAILEQLKPASEEMDQTIGIISRQIEKLREYRQTLIAAAVTGKIQVPAEVAT